MEDFLRNHEDIKLDLPVIPEGSEATMFEYLVDEKGMDFGSPVSQCRVSYCIVLGICTSICIAIEKC